MIKHEKKGHKKAPIMDAFLWPFFKPLAYRYVPYGSDRTGHNPAIQHRPDIPVWSFRPVSAYDAGAINISYLAHRPRRSHSYHPV